MFRLFNSNLSDDVLDEKVNDEKLNFEQLASLFKFAKFQELGKTPSQMINETWACDIDRTMAIMTSKHPYFLNPVFLNLHKIFSDCIKHQYLVTHRCTMTMKRFYNDEIKPRFSPNPDSYLTHKIAEGVADEFKMPVTLVTGDNEIATVQKNKEWIKTCNLIQYEKSGFDSKYEKKAMDFIDDSKNHLLLGIALEMKKNNSKSIQILRFFDDREDLIENALLFAEKQKKWPSTIKLYVYNFDYKSNCLIHYQLLEDNEVYKIIIPADYISQLSLFNIPQEIPRTASLKKPLCDDQYTLLDIKEENEIELENKRSLQKNRALPIANEDIIHTLLPFLTAEDRAHFSNTAKTFQDIDPLIKQIHALQKWEKIVEQEANQLGLIELAASRRGLFSIMSSLAAAGSAMGIYYLVKLSTENNEAIGRILAPILTALAGLGTLCCMGSAVRALYAPLKDPSAYHVNRENRFLTSASTEVKKTVNEFNDSNNDSPVDLKQTTFLTFKQRLNSEKERIIFFMDHAKYTVDTGIEIKPAVSLKR